jgi:hydroxymethylglutaryl-CoA lyase
MMTSYNGLMSLPAQVQVREVGPRDGLQNEAVNLGKSAKLRLIDALAAAGLSLIEVGAFVHPEQVPQMANTAAVLADLQRHSGVTYSVIVPNLVGARHAITAGADSIQVFLSASESHNQSNVNMSIAQSLEQVAAVAALARSSGTPFDAVISVAFGCPFEGHVAFARVLELSARLLDLGAFQVTLGDTTGMAHPLLVQQLVQAFYERFPRQPLRLHLHSARGAGLANLLAALQLGVSEFDSSIGGIGGCPFAPGAPGNLCTEDVVHMLHEMGVATGLDLEALLAAARFLEEILGHSVPGQTLKAGICKHLLEG